MPSTSHLGLALTLLATNFTHGATISEDENASSDFTQAGCDVTNPFYVDTLPWFRSDETWPCSYAGVLPSNEDESHMLFFWMYPAFDADAPVAVWLNGGPGASSTFANFLFNSPLRIGEPTKDTYDMYTSEDTWINSATMIYIDQPVGTGFSYGEPLLTNLEEVTTEFMTFMRNLWNTFP